MPRHYKRKTNRRNYTSELLEEALAKCRNGSLSIKRCSLNYEIPRTTIRDHLLGRRGTLGSTVGGCGRGTAIPLEKECELATCLKTMSRWGFGLTRTEVLDLVQSYVNTNKIRTVFKNSRPGEDWWLTFKKRHKLSIKKPEPLEHARRTQSSDPFIVYQFFDLLENEVKVLQLQNKPHRIYNCDETSFSHDPSRTKVVTAIGKSCHRVTAGSGRDNTSVLACVNAAGQRLPPLIVFKGKNLWDKWIPTTDTYPNTSYVSTPKGWMTAEIFENWFKKSFLTEIGEERPVLLLFDGHTSHISTQLVTSAIENDVTILKLPPHTSHLLQPLDVACFRGLKAKWDANLTTWQRENIGMRPNKATFSKLLGKAWLALNEENIKSSFRATGIYDFSKETDLKVNRTAISESIFDPEKLKRYKNFIAKKNAENIAENLENMPINISQETIENESSTAEHINAGACSSSTVANETSPTRALQDIGNVSFETLLLRSIGNKGERPSPVQKKRKIAGTAVVLTRGDIDLNSSAKATNTAVATKKTKKDSRNVEPETDSNDSDLTLHNSNSDMDSDRESYDEFGDLEDLQIGDYCLIKFATKKQLRYYVGHIELIKSDECEIKFLRCKNKENGTFKWPDVEDKYSVPVTDIEKKLPMPRHEGRGLLVFRIDFSGYNMS